MMVSAVKNKKGRFLPKEFDISHELCFLIHDSMVEILKAGHAGGFFTAKVDFKNEHDRCSFENSTDIFSWLESEGRLHDRAKVLKTLVLPAVLSDMMHCVFEALENSRKSKLGISYMLIRKPIQESLYLLESIILDESVFAEHMANDPLQLDSKNAGGVPNHEARIRKVIEIIGDSSLFDARYIAQLRYDKNQDDSFYGVCNHAMHLFTSKEPIKTERFNINFIFSQYPENYTQWSYLYSRLPYLLYYTHRVVEHITHTIVPTPQVYLDDIERRISSLTIRWLDTIEDGYINKEIYDFVDNIQNWLNAHCASLGYKAPNKKELLRMSKTGAYPRESVMSVMERNRVFAAISSINSNE